MHRRRQLRSTVLSVWYSARRSRTGIAWSAGTSCSSSIPLHRVRCRSDAPPSRRGVRALYWSLLRLEPRTPSICIYEYIDDPELRHVFFLARRSYAMTAVAHTSASPLVVATGPSPDQFETVACYLCGARVVHAVHLRRGRSHRQAGPLHVRDLRRLRAALSESAAHDRPHQGRTTTTNTSRTARRATGACSPGSSTGRWTGTTGRRTRSCSRFVSLDATQRACSTSAAPSARSSRHMRARYGARGDRRGLQGPERQSVARRRRLPLRPVLRAGLRRRSAST